MDLGLSRRRFISIGGGTVAAGAAHLGTVAPAAAAAKEATAPAGPADQAGEPDATSAALWWPNPRNVWTPVGWKDHLFRFHVFYNGSVVGAPCPPGRITQGMEKYQGQGIQLDMSPWGGWFPSGPMPPLYNGNFYVYREDLGLYGTGNQQMASNPTPVVQSDWPQSNGVHLRQSTFAHVLGGRDIETGTEPIYAWVRLSVEYVDPVKVDPARPVGVAIRVARSYYTQEYPYTFQDGVTLTGYPGQAPFAEDLQVDAVELQGRRGTRLRQPDGTRLVALADGAAPALTQPDSTRRLYNLEVRLPPTPGAHTDILVAMLPQPDDEFQRELALGYDGALAESDAYWSRRPRTAATVQTPERHVDEAIRRNIQYGEIVAHKIPGTDQYTYLTGSFGYDVLWSTPTSMRSHMFLDLLGYHDEVARHLEIYRLDQGNTPPPGSAYPASNPGYYGTPDNLKAINWITDHGAVMLAVATHALVTGDRTFIETWTESLVKACDFVKDACANTNHPGVKGLPPPAVVSDSGVETQSTWMMAWLYKGLTTAIRLLRRIGHPRAEEFARVAEAFRRTFDTAFDAYNANQPKWTAPDGKRYPIYSQYLIDTPPGAFVEAFELDTGAMSLVWGGLMTADDPRMRSFVEYFRVGPNTRLWGNGSRKNPLDSPVLLHEISSCEPIYSWNVFHSWQRGDRDRFLEGMYSLLCGGMSPHTYIPFEHRHGMSSALGTEGTLFWLLRNAVIDDNIVDEELHLLRLCPAAWLSSEVDTNFGQMPTWHGPVSVRVRRITDDQLSVRWSADWRNRPRRVVLHFPPGITRIVVNDKRTYARPSSGTVELAT